MALRDGLSNAKVIVKERIFLICFGFKISVCDEWAWAAPSASGNVLTDELRLYIKTKIIFLGSRTEASIR